MADKIVQVPGLGNVSFPDTMSDDDISAVISKQVSQTQARSPDSILGGIGRRLASMATAEPPSLTSLIAGPIGPVAKGLYQAEQQLGPQFAQQAQAAAQVRKTQGPIQQALPNLNDLQTATTGLSMLNPFASGSVANVNQLQSEGRGQEAIGQGGTDAALLAAGLGVPKLVGAAKSALPSAQRAGATLETVKTAAGGIPIDTTAPGNTSLQLYELRAKGAYVPQSVTKLVQRLSAPDSPPMTYAEAKDFQSIISRLSADDYQRMAPQTKFLVGKLNADLKGSLNNAADVVGKGQQFQQAMQEYHNAMRLAGYTDAIKSAAWKAAIGAAVGTAGAGGVYGLYKMLGLPFPGQK